VGFDGFLVAWIVLACCIAGQFVLVARILARLREHHPDRFAELGSPDLFTVGNDFDRRSWRFFGFAVLGGGPKVSDPSISRLCWALRGLFFTGAFIVVAGFSGLL
jgi:hypothetical protein